jgi:oligopeptide transport system permease protein
MFFLKRLLFLIPLLLVISFLAFWLMRIAPGGPFDSNRVPATPEIERAIRAKYHLDEPRLQQYARYLGDLARGDLGVSTKYRNHTVNDIIRDALPVSLTLGGLAFCFALGLGIPWGVLMAIRRGQWVDHMLGLLSLVGVCLPGFVLGPLLVLGLAVRVEWFPVALWESPFHFVLPTVTLGVLFAGKVARLVRESMTTTLQSEFIMATRARGLSESAIVFKHALRLALLPVVSFSAPMLADLLTGSFVVESIFQIPGLGGFFVNSSLNRDYPLLMGCVLLYAALLLVLNLVSDLLLALLDRRVKYE